MQLKPQDFLVALKLVAWGEQRWTYARLAQELGISVSEAHACIKRGLQAGLHTRPRRAKAASASGADNPARVHQRNLAEFAVHGARYAFAPERLPMAVGVPTSHSAPAFKGVFAPGSADWVWPHPNGTVRGQGLEPLHPSAPFAAMQDAKLYEMLALFDALRMALRRLPQLIYPDGPKPAERPMHG